MTATATERRGARSEKPAKSSNLGRFILARLAYSLIVVVSAATIVFLLMQVVGDPVTKLLPIGTSQERIDAVRESLGLNDPLYQQLWRFYSNAAQGDFGDSFSLGGSAFHAALAAVPTTFVLVVPATVIGVFLGSAAGLYVGARPGTTADRIFTSLAYLTISVAEFWLALLLIYLLAAQWHWTAAGGYGLDFEHMAIPIFIFALRPFAHSLQLMRVAVIQEMRSGYVLAARSRGASGRRIMLRHVLRNSSIGVVSVAFYDLSKLFVAGGVVEIVLGWPGLGRLAVGALDHGDIPLIQATVVVAAVVVCLLNLVGDLCMFWLDPRTRDAVSRVTS